MVKGLLLAASTLVPAVPSAQDALVRPFLEAHCVRCHRDSTEESRGLDLSAATPGSPIGSDPGGDGGGAAIDWDWLAERVEFKEMPPPGEPQPTADEAALFVKTVRDAIASVDGLSALPTAMPPAPLRRLTAAEYRRAVRDLLGVSIDAERILPEDAVGHGFDHVASAQNLSESHIIQIIEAAEKSAERAVPVGESALRRYRAVDGRGGHRARSHRVLSTRGTARVTADFPRRGRYIVRAEVFGFQAGDEPCRARLVLDSARSQEAFDVPATQDAPMLIEAELVAERAGDLEVGVSFLNDFYSPATEEMGALDRNFAVRLFEVVGPLDAAEPTEFMLAHGVSYESMADQAVHGVVRQLAEIIWRGADIADTDVDALCALSEEEDSSAVRVNAALTAMLASPKFLVRVEGGEPGAKPDARGSVPLSAPSLAQRLASFLWGSVPDGALMASALGCTDADSTAKLAAQMLRDPRATDLAQSFGDQWLQLRALEGQRADRKTFPGFDGELAAAMLEETRRVVADSLLERRNLWDLVDGETTFVNARLAGHYGLAAEAFEAGAVPRAGEWVRASVADTPRRGLLGHAGVLFATSEATRTSPVRRGKWVLDVLLGSAPPPPPPGADNLPKVEEGAEQLSLRERFEAHRRDPTCASCHARMDPIGFGLEAFDGIGGLRKEADPAAANLHGELPDGRSFNGPIELAAVLRGEERFLEALAERVLVYALGRGLERADRGAVRAMVEGLDPEHPTLEDLFLGAVRTDEFRRLRVTTEREERSEDSR